MKIIIVLTLLGIVACKGDPCKGKCKANECCLALSHRASKNTCIPQSDEDTVCLQNIQMPQVPFAECPFLKQVNEQNGNGSIMYFYLVGNNGVKPVELVEPVKSVKPVKAVAPAL